MKHHRTTLAMLLAGALTSPAVQAQGTTPSWGGSENHVASTVAIGAGGGPAESASYRAIVNIGLASAGFGSSASYELEGGTVGVPESITGWKSALFGFSPALGDKDGGEYTRMFGFKLTGLADVTFNGVSAAGFGATNPLWADVQTPPGVNAYGNPFGRVETVSFSLGKPALEQGFGYLPLIQTENVPALGGSIHVRYLGESGSFGWLAFGLSVPGIAIPIPPFEGAVETLLKSKLFPIRYAPEGVADWVLPIPDDPTLQGFPLEFQALSITSPDFSSGEYTNLLEAPIQ